MDQQTNLPNRVGPRYACNPSKKYKDKAIAKAVHRFVSEIVLKNMEYKNIKVYPKKSKTMQLHKRGTAVDHLWLRSIGRLTTEESI